jgi:hypothetical protein
VPVYRDLAARLLIAERILGNAHEPRS